MSTQLNPFRSKISRALVVYVLLFSSAITLILTALQLYSDYRYDRSLIDERLAQIEISNVDGLAQNMWTLNDGAIRLLLDGLLKQPDIIYLEVTDTTGAIIDSTGFLNTDNIVRRTYPVRYKYRGVTRELGTLLAVATLENVYQRLIDTFIVILVTQGIKTFLVSAFIIFIVAHTITRHLAHFSAHAKQLNPDYPLSDLRLERKPGRMNRDDELDQLAASFNAMQANVRRGYAELAYSESVLEKAQAIAHIGSWELLPESGKVAWSNEAAAIVQCDALQADDGLEAYVRCAHPDDRERLREGLRHTQKSGETLYLEHRIICDDGSEKAVEFRAQYYRDEDSATKRLIGTIHDVTVHRQHRDALHNMANFDSLTGLPNRWMLNNQLDQTIAATHGTKRQFMLALLDLDGFKEVNDSLGHHAGDELLRQIRPRLSGLLRESDTLARLGGDEFAVVLSPLASISDGMKVIQDLVVHMNQPFDVGMMNVKIDVSIGISLFPDQAGDGSTLLRYADIAMYHAKRSKLQHAIYSAEIDPHTPRRLELISDLETAISENQLVLHYQPKVDGRSGELHGVEALVRWQHPAHGFVPPDEFVPLCEISNIIRPLTLWVLRRAVEDHRRWCAAGFDFGVSVNVSVRNLLDDAFPQEVIAILGEHATRPESLTLEITESALMEDPRRARTNIDRLHEAGVCISIDDFGTGYSSLSYLKHLPVQELKIDRGFVSDMLANEHDAVIVKSTVDLAHSLGIRVTAEGVENAAVVRQLQDMACDYMQGFHFAKPMPYPGLVAWLEARHGTVNTGSWRHRGSTPG